VFADLPAPAPVEHAPPLDPWLSLSLAVVLIGLNAFFVAAEFALVQVRPTQIAPLKKRGDLKARTVIHILGRMDSYLSAAQLGITLASLALGWIGEPAFAWILRPIVAKIPGATPALLHSVSLTCAFLVITSLHIVIGEQVPKWVGLGNPKTVSLWAAIPMYAFHQVSYPFTWVLNKTVNAVLRVLGLSASSGGHGSHTEDELRLLLTSGQSGRLSKQKRELLDNVFKLSERTARQIMVPRADVIYLSLARSQDENMELVKKTEFTRFPLCTADLDQVIGMVHIKDVFNREALPTSFEDVKREIHFVPDSLNLDRLLRRMRKEREHMVAVLDEYGGVAGIVTLEDVIEEIVGQIQDEFDQEKPELVREKGNAFRVSGSMLVVDLEDALNVEFSERDEDTVGGVVLSELGRPPKNGDVVQVGEVRFEVLESSRRRINMLLVTITPQQPAAN
jgi:CBS domain containing-hemolysin-like protein